MGIVNIHCLLGWCLLNILLLCCAWVFRFLQCSK